MNSHAIYAGSFDPITKGHLDIIQRALNIFDTVHVSVIDNIEKQPLFTIDERIDLISNSMICEMKDLETYQNKFNAENYLNNRNLNQLRIISKEYIL